MSEDGGLYNLQNVLTNLAVRVGQLEGTIKTFMENWAAQDRLAHDSRRTTYERIELLGRQIDRVASDVHGLQQDFAELKKEIDEEMKPVITGHEFNAQRNIGAKSVWGMIAGAIFALAGLLTWLGDKIATHVWPK